jgi:hypothetical protein
MAHATPGSIVNTRTGPAGFERSGHPASALDLHEGAHAGSLRSTRHLPRPAVGARSYTRRSAAAGPQVSGPFPVNAGAVADPLAAVAAVPARPNAIACGHPHSRLSRFLTTIGAEGTRAPSLRMTTSVDASNHLTIRAASQIASIVGVSSTAFACRRHLCRISSVYPFGCAAPSKTSCRAALKLRLAPRSRLIAR